MSEKEHRFLHSPPNPPNLGGFRTLPASQSRRIEDVGGGSARHLSGEKVLASLSYYKSAIPMTIARSTHERQRSSPVPPS
jgi:hypothetical protein